jgi:hypothetical protein
MPPTAPPPTLPPDVRALIRKAEQDGFIGNELVRNLLDELEAPQCDPEHVDTLIKELRHIPALAR